MQTLNFNCRAVQHSDQMHCAICNLTWDMNDHVPPPCRPRSARLEFFSPERRRDADDRRDLDHLIDRLLQEISVSSGTVTPLRRDAARVLREQRNRIETLEAMVEDSDALMEATAKEARAASTALAFWFGVVSSALTAIALSVDF